MTTSETPNPTQPNGALDVNRERRVAELRAMLAAVREDARAARARKRARLDERRRGDARPPVPAR